MEVGNPGGLEGVIGGQHSESTSPGMQHLRPPCNTARALTTACRARFMQHSKSTHQMRESWDEPDGLCYFRLLTFLRMSQLLWGCADLGC